MSPWNGRQTIREKVCRYLGLLESIFVELALGLTPEALYFSPLRGQKETPSFCDELVDHPACSTIYDRRS